MAEIILRFDVAVDPTQVTPGEVADELFRHYDQAIRTGNAKYRLAEGYLDAEWD